MSQRHLTVSSKRSLGGISRARRKQRLHLQQVVIYFGTRITFMIRVIDARPLRKHIGREQVLLESY